MRFYRDYRVIVAVSSSESIIIKPPLRIAFDCDKSTKSSLNKLTIKIYNLNESNRMALVKDENQKKRIPIQLSVGYGAKLENLFVGDVNIGFLSKEENDFIVTLECYDGGYDYVNSFTSKTVRGKETAVSVIINDMPNLGIGKVTKQSSLVRPRVLVGSSSKLLEQMLDGDERFFIDNEQIFIVREGEVPSSYIPVVSSETGLINTPERDRGEVSFDTMLNPSLRVGHLCKLDSSVSKSINGVYKISQINYTGDIDGDDWNQSVTATEAKNYKVI